MNRKIKLIDTHCHLEMSPFNPDREAVIQRAKDAGLEAMITIGSDLKGNIGGVALSRKYDFIYASVGFHPHDAKDFTEEIFNKIKAWASPVQDGTGKRKVVAIGEIGLDYHYDHSPRDMQRKVFMQQLRFIGMIQPKRLPSMTVKAAFPACWNNVVLM